MILTVYIKVKGTHVECSQQPSHSDFLLEHFSGALLFESVFNTDFPSMIRLNNIIGVTKSAVYDSYGVCLICITLLLALVERNDVPLDSQKRQFHLDCRIRTGMIEEVERLAHGWGTPFPPTLFKKTWPQCS